MFEHLDDPTSPAVTSATWAAVDRRMRALRRQRQARRLLAGAGAVMAIAGAGIAWEAWDRDDSARVAADRPAYDVPAPGTSPPTRPVDVTGHRANKLSTEGPLDGWLLETYPVPVSGESTFLRLGVRDADGPTPRPVSLEYGDGTKTAVHLPPCPPSNAIPASERTGEHVYYSFDRTADGRPSFWHHTYAAPGTYVVTVVFESGCGAPSRERSTARFELTVHPSR